MSVSDFARRGAALLAVLLPLAACDDPLRPREAPEVERLAMFTVLDPDRFTTPVLVQHAYGPLLALRGALREGTTVLADSSVVVPADANALYFETWPCFLRYRQPTFTSPWMMRCVELPFVPNFGGTYEVEVTSPGRPTVRGTTTVPGDFEMVTHELERLPSGDVRLNVVWRASAQSYRYLVAVQGWPVGQPVKCAPDSSCHDRWFAVTSDTSISTVIPAKYFVESSLESPETQDVFAGSGIVVHALSRELYGYMLTGVTSDFFPVPPAQNAVGGLGAVGAWVKRVAVTQKGLSLQRVAGGMKLTSHRDDTFEYQLANGGAINQSILCHYKSPANCATLAPGATVFIPYSQIVDLDRPEMVNYLELKVWLPGDYFISFNIPIYFF